MEEVIKFFETHHKVITSRSLYFAAVAPWYCFLIKSYLIKKTCADLWKSTCPFILLLYFYIWNTPYYLSLWFCRINTKCTIFVLKDCMMLLCLRERCVPFFHQVSYFSCLLFLTLICMLHVITHTLLCSSWMYSEDVNNNVHLLRSFAF